MFLPLQVKLGHWFYISQNWSWELKKTGKHCKYFYLLYKNFMSKQSIPPLSKQPPAFSPTPPFLEKKFHPHTYCQKRGTQSPLWTMFLFPQGEECTSSYRGGSKMYTTSRIANSRRMQIEINQSGIIAKIRI